jgi:hypothetical protein
MHKNPSTNEIFKQGKEKIKDELNQAVQEGYSKDYEDLIRKYYEALQNEKIKN